MTAPHPPSSTEPGLASVDVESPTLPHRPAPHDELLEWQTMLRQVMRILIPTDISCFLWMSSQTITLSFVGHNLGQMGVAQYSAAIILFNMTGFSIIQGFGAAIDTLASQAYGRDRHSPQIGETLQIALALNLSLGALMSFFFFHSSALAFWVFGDEVGPGVATFLRYSPPYLFALIVSGIMSKIMYAQKLPEVVAAANFAAALTSPIAGYYLTPLGIHGAALSLFITALLCSITHVACAIFHPKAALQYAQWPSPCLRDVAAWKCFMRIGFPSVLSTCAEWWAFEIQAILAASISPLALAIHGVGMNLVSLLFSIALGICVAASVITGHALGAGRPRQAEQIAHFILYCDVAIEGVASLLMIIFGQNIARFYSSEEEVVHGVEKLMPFIIACHFGDSVQFCLQGIYRGAGKQKLAGVAVLATLWGVGVPFSAFFVLVMHTGVAGCISGLLVGFVLEIPLLYMWMLKFDWPRLAEKAQRGVRDDDGAGAMDVVVEDPGSPATPHDGTQSPQKDWDAVVTSRVSVENAEEEGRSGAE